MEEKYSPETGKTSELAANNPQREQSLSGKLPLKLKELKVTLVLALLRLREET